MDVNRICLKCMREKSAAKEVCPVCSYRNEMYHPPFGALAPWTILRGRYLIGTVLEQTDYDFRYIALDLISEQRVVIIEYFERAIIRRQPDGLNISYLYTAKMQFSVDREAFTRYAQELRQDTIQGRSQYAAALDVFKENHTFYLVQDNSGKLMQDRELKRVIESQDVRVENRDAGPHRQGTPADDHPARRPDMTGSSRPVYEGSVNADHRTPDRQEPNAGNRPVYDQSVNAGSRLAYRQNRTVDDSRSYRQVPGGEVPVGGNRPSYGQEPQDTTGASGHREPNKRKRGRGKKVWILVAASLLAIIGAVVLIWLLRKNKPSGEEIGGSSTTNVRDDSAPAKEPTPEPIKEPTPEPAKGPTPEPAKEPTPEPTKEPTPAPANEPTPAPAKEPTPEPAKEPTPAPAKEPTPGPAKKPAVSGGSSGNDVYTMMIYMVGADLESQMEMASTKIKEISSLDIDTERVNILIYTGGSSRWADYRIPSDRNCIWRVTGGADGIECLERTDDPVNTGEADVLADFINFSQQNYPADHYALMFWDHGGGPEYGVGEDENFEYDSITLEELKRAMSMTAFGKSLKMDWVGFDACVMSSLEVADALDEYAGYMIASEEMMPTWGMGYSFLEMLETGADAKSICIAAAEEYIDTMMEIIGQDETEYYNPLLTISCSDLSQTESVKNALGDFSSAALNDIAKGGRDAYARLLQQRSRLKQLGLFAQGGKSSGTDLVDLKDLVEVYRENYPAQAERLEKSLAQMVTYNYSNEAGASGLSLYFPCDNLVDYLLYGNQVIGVIACPPEYLDLASKLVDWRFKQNSGNDWGNLDPVSKNGEVVLSLTSEQEKELYQATYTIFMVTSEGYVPVLMDVETEPENDGRITVDGSQKLVYLQGYGQNNLAPLDLVIPVRQIEYAQETGYYITENIQVMSEAGFAVNTYQDISVNFTERSSLQEVTVVNVSAVETEELSFLSYGGKNEVWLNEWNELEYKLKSYEPGYNESGVIYPYYSWKDNGVYNVGRLNLDEELVVRQLPLRDADARFACQILLEDVYGAVHPTEIVELN